MITVKKKVQISIGHPGHVHFFKNIILQLQRDGIKVKIVARKKDVTLELLKSYKIDFEIFPNYRSNLLYKALDRIFVTYFFYKIAKKFKPDIFLGIGGAVAAHVGKLTGKPSIIFTDTEHASIQNAIAFPFATTICTPSCFKQDLGKKQIRYNGYHELAYLHPNYFTPNPSVLDELGLKEGERFIVMRFVAWDAVHDKGHSGINLEIRRRLVHKLEKYGKVLITSETELPKDFEPYVIRIKPEKMHDLLYYSSLYIGDGATMATEAGILGTPSIYVSSLVGTMGNFDELEKKYGLVFAFQESDLAIKKAMELIQQPHLRDEWRKKKEKLLRDKIDVTAFMVKFIENYPKNYDNGLLKEIKSYHERTNYKNQK